MVRVLVIGMTNLMGGMESVIMNYYRHIDREKFKFDFFVAHNVGVWGSARLKLL